MNKERDIRIFEVDEAKERYVNDVNRLLAQLSSSPHIFTVENLLCIVESTSSHLFFAEYGEDVVGMITVGEYLTPTGRKMWIEDVVVDEAMRGCAIGRALVEHAIAFSESLGKGTLMLTSRSSRIAANALYRSCGFQYKETNMYRMLIEENKDC